MKTLLIALSVAVITTSTYAGGSHSVKGHTLGVIRHGSNC